MKYLVITYEHHLGSFLDEKGMVWSSPVGKLRDTICVHLPKSYTATQVWNLRVEFEQWKERYCSEY